MLPTCRQVAASGPVAASSAITASGAVAASGTVAASGAIAACGEVAGIYWRCTCWFKASSLRERFLAWGYG